MRKPSHSPEVRVRFDERRGGSVVDVRIDMGRVSALLAAIAAAARRLHAVIARLELRPRSSTLDAHIVVASDRSRVLDPHEQNAFVTTVLEAVELALAAPATA